VVQSPQYPDVRRRRSVRRQSHHLTATLRVDPRVNVSGHYRAAFRDVRATRNPGERRDRVTDVRHSIGRATFANRQEAGVTSLLHESESHSIAGNGADVLVPARGPGA
jgi:hypothetical protein